MKYIQSSDRKQTTIFTISMDMTIDVDIKVRIINFFVDCLYPFKQTHISQ